MHATTTSRSRLQRGASSAQADAPRVTELLRELAVAQAQLALQTAEVERLKQICCPWQAYSWHRWPH
jgi:hypothetical protein